MIEKITYKSKGGLWVEPNASELMDKINEILEAHNKLQEEFDARNFPERLAINNQTNEK